jgi:DNA repair protein RadC
MEYSKTELLQMLRVAESKNPVLKISAPSDIASSLMIKYGSKKAESFIVVTLDGGHNVIRIKEVTKGILNRCIVHPREIFYEAVKDRACSIIVAHNHPSGNLEPSREDKNVTERLKEAGVILGIELLDHIIVSSVGYYSFLEEGDI